MNAWECYNQNQNYAYVLLFENDSLLNSWTAEASSCDNYSFNTLPSALELNSGDYTLVYGSNDVWNGSMSISEGMGVNDASSL
jgi:hypothetical protein